MPIPHAAADGTSVEVSFSDAECAALRSDIGAACEGTHPVQQQAEALIAWGEAEAVDVQWHHTPWAAGRGRRVRWADESPGELWVVGDLHGDLLSLEATLAAIDALAAPGAQTVFLGDYIDRGPFSAEVVLRLLERLREAPRTTLCLAGNHDTALTWQHGAGRFSARCWPAEYAEGLNDPGTASWRHRLGRLAIDWFDAMPRAVFCRSGLAMVHAGIPQRDLWPDLLTSRDAFERPEALRDFAWCRATRMPRKDAYRGGFEAEFGYRDFADFCAWMAEGPIGWPVQTMITGHEHVPDRVHRWPRTDPYALWTVCGLSWRAGEVLGTYARSPVIMRVRGSECVPHRLVLPTSLLEEVVVRAAYEPAVPA